MAVRFWFLPNQFIPLGQPFEMLPWPAGEVDVAQGMSAIVAEDAVHRVLRDRYEKGDLWAVQVRVELPGDGGAVPVSWNWEWRFTTGQVYPEAHGNLEILRAADESEGVMVLVLAAGQWKRAVRL